MGVEETVRSEVVTESAELVVAIGDAATLTRGGGGSGSDDKRYTYQR